MNLHDEIFDLAGDDVCDRIGHQFMTRNYNKICRQVSNGDNDLVWFNVWSRVGISVSDAVWNRASIAIEGYFS